ncbi:HEAT repeat domain-containing protein [Thermosynechococcaceae cyanobacterium BACA0444]|uniref:HEAT repeat domain-containing protein n=1 Tax=Pseudocalidococcus azoricus BACA0444 TaxID=2918990 RepID=A0AAE4FSC1_9CYAN|nr:HEAT repeat domain-containing protein [Pseudocalidococcus azoricus]MDS3861260.1 HEAT repeat domain-containing protein [Pseudocalidococcus azoricus BACA0444]
MATATSLMSLIQAVEQAETPAGLIQSVEALAATGSLEAIPPLMAVLGYNNPGAALVAMNGLVRLGHAAVQPLLTGLDSYNYGARAYAIRALAMIAHPDALEILLQAALSDFAPSVRRAATKGLGGLDWHLVADVQVLSAQARVIVALEQLVLESDWALRYAAVVAATHLLPQVRDESLGERLLTLLQTLAQCDSDVAVRARIQLFARSSALRDCDPMLPAFSAAP